MKTLFRIFRWENARAILIVLIFGAVMADALYFLESPAIPLLPPYRDGAWIRANRPMSLIPYRNPVSTAYFRKYFRVSAPQRDVDVAVTAFREVSVFMDGKPLPLSVASSWKEPVRFMLFGRMLTPGVHELRLEVVNRLAAPLFHLSSSLRGLGSVEGWESSPDRNDWRPALRGDEKRDVEIRGMLPTVSEGLRRSLAFIIPIFLGTFVLAAARPRFAVRMATPGSVRILLLLLLVILGVNDMFKLPVEMGFDARQHLEYISYIFRNFRIPLASEGSQMFQSPFYYLVSALFYSVLDHFVASQLALILLRLIPLGCALLLVEITCRLLRELFPGREDLQSVGLFIGGLLPMNLYMCQYVGNEPLAAVLTALLLLLTVKTFRRMGPARMRDGILPGVVAGLAILTKVTPLLLIPVVCCLILIAPGREEDGVRARLKTATLFLLAVVLVSGWFFARNWLVFGKPFVGGWDPSRDIIWWQDPGYRLPSDFYAFGDALRQPVYAAFNGFADAIYSTFWSDGYLSGKALYSAIPAWNYAPLAAGVALSVVPAAAMVVGVAVTFRRSGRREWWPFTFLAVSIGVYFAALLNLYALLPIVSTGKASYTMGLTPCYAVMAALGAGVFIRRKYAMPLFVSLLVTWGTITYIGFFVL